MKIKGKIDKSSLNCEVCTKGNLLRVETESLMKEQRQHLNLYTLI